MSLKGRGTPTITRPPFSERDLARTVIDYAKLCGWRCYYTWYRATVNEGRQGYQVSGFPDIVAVRESDDGSAARLIFAELKVGGNKPTPAQQEWLVVLGKVKGAEVYLWREMDWDKIAEVLR